MFMFDKNPIQILLRLFDYPIAGDFPDYLTNKPAFYTRYLHVACSDSINAGNPACTLKNGVKTNERPVTLIRSAREIRVDINISPACLCKPSLLDFIAEYKRKLHCIF